MAHPALGAAVGLAAGALSGAFGIGGGLVTTPAIRLLLGYPALIAVGTPLPVIIPTALAGAATHRRLGSSDLRAAAIMGAAGAGSAAVGAWLTRYAGGSVVMLVTAAVIAWVASGMIRRATRHPDRGAEPDDPREPEARAPAWRLAAIGLVTGLYSGFLGLGGGVVIVPALHRWLGWPIKRSIGTSLATVALLAIPGSIAHYAIGNVDLPLALVLLAGSVPGALIGARLAVAASERHVVTAFGIVLVLSAAALAWSEMAVLLS